MSDHAILRFEKGHMQIDKLRVTCRKDGTVFDAEIVTHAPIDVWIASIRAVRCSTCGAAADDLVMGGSYNDAPPATAPVADRASWWKARGYVGFSSETIWRIMLDTKPLTNANVPQDPADFRRCRAIARADSRMEGTAR